MPLPFYWLLRIRRGSTGKVSDQWGTGAPIYDNQNIIFILSSPAWNVTFKPPQLPNTRTYSGIILIMLSLKNYDNDVSGHHQIRWRIMPLNAPVNIILFKYFHFNNT